MEVMINKGIQIALLCCLIWTCGACLRNVDDVDRFEEDETAVSKYVSENNLVGTKTTNGVFYSKISEGNGTTVQLDDIVLLKYKLSLTSGEEISSFDNYIFRPQVGAFLYGITEGVLQMTENEKATLVIPALLAFGDSEFRTSRLTIPAYSVIIAEVEVVEVRTDAEQLIAESAQIEEVLATQNLEWERTESGVYYVQVQEGTGTEFPQLNQTVQVDYKGSLLNGTIFDQGQNFTFQVGTSNIIAGWNIGVQKVKLNETALWVIPSALAYEDRGAGNTIPPFTPLMFEVTLKNIVD